MMTPESADTTCERLHFTMDELVIISDEFSNKWDRLECALDQTILLYDLEYVCRGWVICRQTEGLPKS